MSEMNGLNIMFLVMAQMGLFTYVYAGVGVVEGVCIRVCL